MYLPSLILKEQSIYFEIDNVDFKNDTIDGKNEFHSTGIVVYQSVKNNEGNFS